MSLIGLYFPAQAELPPFVYDEMKRNATDVVIVQIVDAPKAGALIRGKRQQVTYEAKVLRVIRSKSRLRPGGGMVIQSSYYRFGPGEVGPSNPRRLKKNDVVMAYLSKGEKAGEFRIAAGGHSFEEPKKNRGNRAVDVPANPVEVEPVPVPPIQTELVEPAPPPHPVHPIGGPFRVDPPIAIAGGGMGIVEEMPGRFEIIPVQLMQAGKPMSVVLKLDTQTGEVWQLKMKTSKFFLNGQPQVRSSLSFEPLSGARPPRPDRGHVMPGRPAIGRGEETVPDDDIEIEVAPERPRLRPQPIPERPPRRVPERSSSRESTSEGESVTVVRQEVAVTEGSPPALKKAKANSSKVTGTVVTAGSVKDYVGLALELRLYEYHPFIADKPADLVAKLNLKNYGHKAGKETKTQFTIGEDGKIKPGMSYYLTCFVIDAKGKRYLMGEKDAKRGLCKVLTGGNPKKVNLVLRDLRR